MFVAKAGILIRIILSILCATLLHDDDLILDRPVLSWEVKPTFWELQARRNIYYSSRIFPHLAQSRARNAIIFLGRGMASGGMAGARFYKSFKEKNPGDVSPMNFESWPFSAFCRSYNLETVVADEASSATALLSGTKTRTNVVGLTGNIKQGMCQPYIASEKTMSVLKAAIRANLATGIVTNGRLTQASVAANFGAVADSRFENDWEIDRLCNASDNDVVMDLAAQLVFENSAINVNLGGGQQNFYPEDHALPSNASLRGLRRDGLNLAEQWLNSLREKGRRTEYASNASELREKLLTAPDHLLGLLAPSDLPAEIDRQPHFPSLANLTMTALEVLKRQSKGFFLFVEGGPTKDSQTSEQPRFISLTAGNKMTFRKIYEDILAFDNAVMSTLATVNLRETLVVVIAANSKSPQELKGMNRFEKLDDKNNTFNSSTAHRDQGDMAVYALGPMSYVFHRTIDDTFVAHAIKYALCLPPYHTEIKRCHLPTKKSVKYKTAPRPAGLLKYLMIMIKGLLHSFHGI